MKKLLLPVLICLPYIVPAQVKPAINPADTVPAIIDHTLDGNTAKFTPQLRELTPIAGAPAPFYTYLWEFGDGTFSFDKDPLHMYTDTGKYNVRLFATNNYDDGKRPPTRPKPIVVKQANKPMMAAVTIPGFFKPGGSISLKNNCMPKPGDDMMLILGYRNKSENLKPGLGGTIAILYNDREFSTDNFELAEARTYHNETAMDLQNSLQLATNIGVKTTKNRYFAQVLSGISQSDMEEVLANEAQAVSNEAKNFKSSKAWHFANLKQGEEHYLFLHFKTTPAMIRDTNATVRLTGMFLPDDPSVDKETFNIELQIVASHDPNKIAIGKTRMNYRLTGKHRELTYRVRFQNNGKGPAKKVDVGVSLSPLFDPATIHVSKTKPEVAVSDAGYTGQSHMSMVTGNDSVHFIFNNIYLPGSQQEGVHDADSTQGFVEYKIRFVEKPPKLPFYTGAAIVFDKNEPVRTNHAAGRFKMGLSPAIIAGFGSPFKTDNSKFITQKNVVLGASIAPYSPYRKYLQAEVYLSDFQAAEQTRSVTTSKDTVIGKSTYRITNRSQTISNKVTTLNLVPVSLRYNFNDWVGAGVGALVSVDLSNNFKNNINYALTGVNGVSDTNLEVLADNLKKTFTDMRASVFADVVVGRVRVGPSLGFRYFYDPKSAVSRTTMYVTWKF